jgi:hypothetical protein
MSIAQNVKLLNKPINELAMLSQETIMSMAQSGQIPVQYVAPILEVKAKQAQTGAEIAAMAAQQDMPAGTVLEGLLAQNAANEAKAEMPAIAQQTPMALPENSGIAALPVSEEMVPDEYAGGGIVAFQGGGATSMYGDLGGNREIDPSFLRAYQAASGARMSRKELVDLMNLAELQEYNRTGKIPARLAQQVQGRAIEGVPMFGSGIYGDITEAPPVAAPAVNQTSSEANRLLAANAAAAATPSGQQPRAPATPTQAGPSKASMSSMSAADQLKRIAELNRLAGVSEDPDAAIRESLAKQRAESKEAGREANAMALIAAGLGIAGGDSPYALQNLKGAIPALQQLGADKKEIRKLNRESDKIEAELARAADARKRGNVERAIELEDKAQARAIQLRGVIAQEAAANRPSGDIQFIERMRDPEFAALAEKAFRIKAEPKSREAALKEWSENPILQKNFPEFKNYYASISGTGAATKPNYKEKYGLE